MNYEDMSDFEINSKVALFLGKSVSREHECINTGSCFLLTDSSGDRIEFNPCNNPSDAWPIVELIWERLMQVDAYYQAHTKWEAYCIEREVGKLRAAMICFLKMKDAENGR